MKFFLLDEFVELSSEWSQINDKNVRIQKALKYLKTTRYNGWIEFGTFVEWFTDVDRNDIVTNQVNKQTIRSYNHENESKNNRSTAGIGSSCSFF